MAFTGTPGVFALGVSHSNSFINSHTYIMNKAAKIKALGHALANVVEAGKALDNGYRLQMLMHLAKHNRATVTGLANAIGISQSLAGQHVGILNHSGLTVLVQDVDDRRKNWVTLNNQSPLLRYISDHISAYAQVGE